MTRLHFAVALFATIGCSGLEAQTTIMKASIPFDFQVGKTAMPAGQYDVNYSSGVLTLRERTKKQAAIVLTLPASRPQRSDTGALEFTRYGDTYFFARVWTPNSLKGGALPKTAREKELASQRGGIQPTEIALNNK